MLKIRRSRDRLIFNMGIPSLVRRHLYIATAPRALIQYKVAVLPVNNSHFGDKTVVKSSYLHNGNSHTNGAALLGFQCQNGNRYNWKDGLYIGKQSTCDNPVIHLASFKPNKPLAPGRHHKVSNPALYG